MSKNQKKLYIIGSILIIFLFSVFLIITSFRKNANLITTPLRPEVGAPLLNQGGVRGGNSLEQENTQSVTILTGNIITHLSFPPNTLFYDALVQAKNAGQISFAGKNYPGLGFFVTDIGTLHAGSGKHLLYYINGKEASVGVSLYTPKEGDIIEWKLE